jgi:Tol biopolymer transport system component
VIGRAIDDLIPLARGPRLSPDETRLLLTIGTGNNGQLWVYPLNGRPPIPLTATADNFGAVWSPDGSEVAFTQARGAQVDILRRRADTSVLEAQPLRAEGLPGVPYDWSSDGELILGMGAFTIDGIGSTRAAEAGELRNIVVTDFAESDADLSTDGRWLAYVSDRTGRPEIWVQPYPEGIPELISESGGYEPRWSPDGRELFYLQGATLMAVKAEPDGEFARAVPLFVNASFFLSSSPITASYDVARDGRFLMLQEIAGTDEAAPASIVVVENWSEELRQRLP